MADQDPHLKSIVQSAVAKHFNRRQPSLPPRWPSPECLQPPSDWKAAIEWINNKMNKST